MQGAF